MSDDDLDFAALVDPSLGREGSTSAPRTAEPQGRGSDAIDRRADVEPSRAPSAPTIAHASYCGASDLGAILGCDPFKTALDVWARKTGRIAGGGEQSEEIDAGNDHEEGVIKGALRKLRKLGVLAGSVYPGPGTIRGGDFVAWRGATCDALVWLKDGSVAPLEAKLVGAGLAHEWGPEPAGADGIPARVLAQVHWQALHLREHRRIRESLTDDGSKNVVRVAYVAADVMGTDRRLYEIRIDDDLIAELLDAARAWWARYVVGDEMPVPSERDIETLGRLFPRVERPMLPDASPDLVALAEDYDAARAMAKRHEQERDRIGALLRAAVGDAEGFKWAGGSVRWSSSSRPHLDVGALEAEVGADAIARHTTRRPLRVMNVRMKGRNDG